MAEELHSRISIFVNGRGRQVSRESKLGELAAVFGLDSRRLLVELNGQTLLHDEWKGCGLSHGDRVEFIRVVAGG